MIPDPKRLIELLRIAQHGSYTRAAAVLGVSQPALSNSIAILEKSLGVRVLERTRRGADLTDFGRALVNHAQSLESLLVRAAEEVRLKQSGLEGSLAIGVSPVACVEVVPDAIARLKRETPNVLVSLTEALDDQLLAMLQTGEIDVMVSPAGPLAEARDIEKEILLTDQFVVVVRPRHPLAGQKSISVAQLRDAQWVMPSAHTAMWRHIEALFAADDVPWPTNCVSTNSIAAVKALVMRTDSVSIASHSVVKLELNAGYLVAIALRSSNCSRDITVRRRRDPSPTPLVQRFIATLHAVAADIRAGNQVRRSSRYGRAGRAKPGR